MAVNQSRDYNEQVGFKWESEAFEEFQRSIAQVKAEGEIDPSMNRSEAIRRILENWAENPDAEFLE